MSSSTGTMRRWRAVGTALGATLLCGAVTAACGVGGGAPDGWAYVNAQGIAFAHPKTWTTMPSSQLPHGVLGGALWKEDGQQVAEVEVLAGVRHPRPERAEVRYYTRFELDGKPAAQITYRYQAHKDGAQLVVMDVTARNAQNMPVMVRISGVGKVLPWKTMERISNSIQIGTIGRGNILEG